MTVRHAAPDARVVARATELLRAADTMVAHARDDGDLSERLRSVYLGALRGAGAALVIGEGLSPRRRTPASAWARLPRSTPSMTGWSTYFADVARLRADVEVGIVRDVDRARVEAVHDRVLDFLDDVEVLVEDYAHGRAVRSGRTAAARSA